MPRRNKPFSGQQRQAQYGLNPDMCTSYECSVADIRLAGSEVDHEGRLEVKVAGRWGTVCDNSFGKEDAAVACHMLGYGYVCSMLQTTRF